MTRILVLILAALLVVLAATALYTRWQSKIIAASYPATGQLVDAGGTSIHLTDLRPAGQEKAVIVLVHGASGNEAEMRKALAPQLLKLNYSVISIDRPGMGWSDTPPGAGGSTLETQVHLIRRALEKHGVKKAIVAVHSLAGAIGLRLALDHKDFVEGLLLISPVTHPWSTGITLYYTISASQLGGLFNHTLALPLGQLFMNAATATVFAPQVPTNDYAHIAGLPLVLRPETFSNNAIDVASLYDFVTGQSPRYKDIRVPVGIIAGDADTIVITDIHSRSSAREIPGATLNILPGTGHAPHWSHTAQVIAEVEKLYGRIDRTTKSAPSTTRDTRDDATRQSGR
jgi:pimeloyl-ACP methyl ester carboxylesterase